MDVRFNEGTSDGVVYNSTESPPFEFSDYGQRVVVATMFLFVTVVGTIGNSLIILAVLLSKKLHMTAIAFLLNLSVADLLTSMVILWDAIAMLSEDGLPFSEWICKVVAVVQFTTVGCSIYTLATVGLNRLILITRPASTYRAVYTPRKTAVWLMFTWLIPFLATLIPPLVGLGAVGYNMENHFCGFISSHPLSGIYNLIRLAVLSPNTPVIIVSYILIWRYLKQHVRRTARSPEETGQPTGNSSSLAVAQSSATVNLNPSSSSGRTVGRSQLTSRQSEITKNMLYVVCAFILCLFPYTITVLIEDSAPIVPYTGAIVYLNSCINPFIYATKHRDFKTVLRCIWRRQWGNIPEPSNFLKTIRSGNCRSNV